MAKATKTIRQRLKYPPQYADYFAANQALFNRVVAFYARLYSGARGSPFPQKQGGPHRPGETHPCDAESPHPILPLSDIAPDIPAMFRRAAINAAPGSARACFSSLNTWRARKEKHEAKACKKGKKKRPFRERPPVPPRTWNTSASFYAGLWKERGDHSIMLKVWTGTCWSWLKVHLLSRDLPEGFEMGSPSLVRKGKKFWLHTPIEKTFAAPTKVVEQIASKETRLCAVDLNLDQHVAVCSVQTVDGTILATSFIGNGTAVLGCRKRLLGRIAHNRSHTKLRPNSPF